MNYSNYKVPQLKSIYKDKGIIKTNRLKKLELIATLLKADYDTIIIQSKIINNIIININN